MEGLEKEAWLAERRTGIGGSDVSAILGINKYKTPYQIWQEKRGEVPEFEGNERTKWGVLHEPLILEEYCKESGKKVLVEKKIIKHSEIPFLMGNVDGVIQADEKDLAGILEIKCVGENAFKYWEAMVPKEYYCQIQHYLYITGLTWGAFAVLVGGNQFHTFPVIRDEEYLGQVVPFLTSWWEKHIIGGVEPEKAATDHADMLGMPVGTITADNSTLTILSNYTQLVASMKIMEKDAEALKDKIKEFIGENEILSDGTGPVASWKKQTRTTLDSGLIKKEFPEIFTKCQKISEFRVLKFI